MTQGIYGGKRELEGGQLRERSSLLKSDLCRTSLALSSGTHPLPLRSQGLQGEGRGVAGGSLGPR